MLLTPSQKIIARDTHRFRVVNCGRRFGKTTLAAEEIKGKVLYKASRIAYVAPTYQQARDIMWELLKKELKPIASAINESRLEIRTTGINKQESFIALRGWESIETLRGQQFDFIVIDEIASMRNWKTNWEEVIRPTLTDTAGGALFISTPKGFNHFYKLYNNEHGDIDYKSFHFSTYDNPHITVEEIDKAKLELTEDRFSQEYLADFRRTEGLVYKEFDRERHIYTEGQYVPIERLVGVDWGYTNPAAVLLIEKDTDHTYWIKEEYYKTQRTTEEIVEYARALGGNKYYPDPAEPDRNEVLRRSGCNIRDVSKDIEAGIQSVRELFKNNRLFIHESCQNLIFELETYHYPDKKPDKNENETPIKENDHLCFTKDTKIELPYGDVISHISMGFKDVYEFMGSKVTANHPYLTQRGFVRLDSLRYSDRIVVWKESLLMELSLEDMQVLSAASLKTILFLLQRNLQAIQLNASTGIYGKSTMGKYLKVCISTIKMVTHLITTYLTSNWYHQKNTIISTTKRCCLSGKTILKKLFRRLVNGLGLLKVRSLEVSVVNVMFSTCHDIASQETVTNVEKNTLPKPNLDASATIIAKLKHLGKEEVFSTATTSGFFIANGVVVSNCDALRYVLYMQSPVGANNMAQTFYSQAAQPKTYLNKLNANIDSIGTPKPIHELKQARTHYPRL